MEQEIILEGIHATLEEIRDNMKRNPEQKVIKSKLETIERVCNEFTGQKFVTEEVMAQFLACTLKKIMEMNEKQDEKIEKLGEYISEHHKYVKEQAYKQQKIISVIEEVKEYMIKPNLLYVLFKRVYKCLLTERHI